MVEVWVVAEDLVSLAWMVSKQLARELGSWAAGQLGLNSHLLHHRQHPWLSVVVSVGANAQVDLVAVGVAAIRGHEPEERIFGRLGDDARVESSGSHGGDVGGYLGEAEVGGRRGLRGLRGLQGRSCR